MSALTQWNHRLSIYIRAHNLPTSIGVRADAVTAWLNEQQSAWIDSDGDKGFDAWLDERFPEPAATTASAVWGNDQEFGF